MRQAIVTKYHGPTNTKGSRISATCDAGRIYVGYDHALDGPENHAAAAKALAVKLGWSGAWRGGGLPKQAGCAFTWAAENDCFTFMVD